MAETKLGLIVEAKNQASGPLRTIKSDLQGLDREAQNVAGGMNTLGKALGVVGLIAVGQQAAQAAAELVDLGSKSISLRNEFEGLAGRAGAAADEMLSAMQRASRGTITEYDLMRAANQAMVLGVADSADEMGAILEFAQTRARQLGISTQFAFESLVTGIGRNSALFLDNVGISLSNINQAMDDYAASIGTTADKLDDAGKKAALLNAVMAENQRNMSGIGTESRTAVESIAAMDVAWTDFKTALGESLVPIVTPVLEGLTGALRQTIEEMRRQGASAALRERVTGTPAYTLLAGIDDPTQQENILRGIIANTTAQAQAAADEAVNLAQNAKAQIDAIYNSTSGISRADAAAIFQSQLDTAVASAATLTNQAATMQAALDGLTGSATQATTAATQAGQAAVGATGEVVAASTAEIDALLQKAQGGLAAIAREIAAVQGNDAAAAWLAGANAQLERQIGLWADAGYHVDFIGNVLLPNWLGNLGEIVGNAHEAFTAVADIGKGAQVADGAMARASSRMMRNLAAVGAAGRRAAVDVSRIGAALAAVRSSVGGGLGDGFIPADAQIEKTTDATTAFDDALSGLLDTAYSGGGGGGVGGIGDEFDDVRSKIESLISSSTTLDFGLDPADFLPREDAINENARRLGAIMRDGIAGQDWLEEFKAEAPGVWAELASSGDPQAAAARILQQFQAGLRPELLDREQIKERVRQMILGDHTTAALASELAAELSAEMGVSLAQAQQAVGALMGTGGTAALTGQAGEGLSGAAQATSFTDSWVQTFNGMLTRFYDTGTAAGGQWGAGFLATVQGGVPGQLIAILVGLVTPGVMAAMAAQGSRTGAQ